MKKRQYAKHDGENSTDNLVYNEKFIYKNGNIRDFTKSKNIAKPKKISANFVFRKNLLILQKVHDSFFLSRKPLLVEIINNKQKSLI